jgi:hypothetical protein
MINKMSIQIHHSKLSQELEALDSQCPGDESPLPLRPTIHLIISKKGGGKSSLLLNILKSKNMYGRKADNIYLFSPTALNDHKFDDLVGELEPEGKYFSSLTDDNLHKCVENIQDFNDNFDKKKKKRDPWNIIIFDDLLAEVSRKGNKAEYLNKIITTCRHLKSSLIFLIQKMKVPPLLRSNADLISLFKITNLQERKDALLEWSIPEHIYDICTKEPFSFLHISYCNGEPLYFKKFSPIHF